MSHIVSVPLLPRARLRDVLRGDAQLVGSRCDERAPRGLVSPIEARVHMGIPYGDLAVEERRYLEQRTTGADAGVVLRALVASLCAPNGDTASPRRPKIVSARVDNITIDEAIDAILAPPSGAHAKMVHFVHPHALNLAAFDRGFAGLLSEADLVLPDGIGLRVAARMMGIALQHNLNGTDLLPLLCRAASERSVPLVFIGGADGVAAECASKLEAVTPGIHIPIAHTGYLSDSAAVEVVGRVRALAAEGPVVVMVGMGSPMQERWSWSRLRDIRGATVITVGGLFDFYSERIPRAPIAWRELGLEWLYRIRQEPRRLAKRYVLGNPLFLALALAQRIRSAP